MTSVTKQAGNTLISMMAAVGTTANTATRAVHTISSGLDMLDQYVQDARREQIARSIFNEESMLERIHEDAAKEAAQRRSDLQRQLDADPVLKGHYVEAYKSFDETSKRIKEKLAVLSNRTALIDN